MAASKTENNKANIQGEKQVRDRKKLRNFIHLKFFYTRALVFLLAIRRHSWVQMDVILQPGQYRARWGKLCGSTQRYKKGIFVPCAPKIVRKGLLRPLRPKISTKGTAVSCDPNQYLILVQKGLLRPLRPKISTQGTPATPATQYQYERDRGLLRPKISMKGTAVPQPVPNNTTFFGGEFVHGLHLDSYNSDCFLFLLSLEYRIHKKAERKGWLRLT